MTDMNTPLPASTIPLVRPLRASMSIVDGLLEGKSDSLTLSNYGSLHRVLEEELEKYTKRPAIPLATGTAAIQIAVWLHCKPGSRIAVPDFTHIGTLQAVVAAHCIPVLFPSNPITWQLDPMTLQANDKAFDAAIVVSPFGYRVETEYYDSLFRKLGKPVIYDFAGAWGHFPHTASPVCYSLHATKNLSCGEGGVLAVGSPGTKEAAQKRSNFNNLPDRQIESPYGNNFKIDEYKAAIILAVLLGSPWAERIEHKKETLAHYAKTFKPLGLSVPLLAAIGVPSLCALGGFEDAKEAEKELVRRGIQARAYYPLLSRMEGLKSMPRIAESGQMLQSVVALPSDVTPEERQLVCHAVEEVVLSQKQNQKNSTVVSPSRS